MSAAGSCVSGSGGSQLLLPGTAVLNGWRTKRLQNNNPYRYQSPDRHNRHKQPKARVGFVFVFSWHVGLPQLAGKSIVAATIVK